MSINQKKTLVDLIKTELEKEITEIENIPIGQELMKDLLTHLCIMNTSHSTVQIEERNGSCEPMSDYEISHLMYQVFVAGTDTVLIHCFFFTYMPLI